MNEELDAPTGGEGMSVEQAADAFLKATTKEAPEGQSEAEETDESTQTDDELQADEQDAGEEDDGEPADEEDQSEEQDEDEPESDQGRYVAKNGKVKLDDGTTVTVDDLLKGNLRQGDYTRKTMELAEGRKTFEAQSAAFKQAETELTAQRGQMVELLKMIVPAAPDPSMTNPASPNFDPVAYQHQKAQHEQWAQHLEKLDGEHRAAAEKGQAEAAEARQRRSVQAAEALIEAVPEFKADKTGKKLDAFYADAREYGAKYGFSTEELVNGIGFDHRMALVMRKAIAFDKLQAAKPKVQAKVENRPPVTRGGKRLSTGEQRARGASEAITRLKQTGTVDDAALAWLASRKG